MTAERQVQTTTATAATEGADIQTASPSDRLLTLLSPVHERARMTARRLCRSDAEGDDLFQDAAVRALAKLPALRDDQAFPAWFYRILLSVHKNRTRGHFWRRLVPMDSIAKSAEPVGDDGSTWEDARHGERRMRSALATLPPVQREAVVLFDIDGYRLAEIAEMQGVSLSAVKSRLVRGRERLRKHYQSHGYRTGQEPERRSWPTRPSMAKKRNAS